MKRENPWYINAFSLIQVLTYLKQEGGGQRKMLKGWKTITGVILKAVAYGLYSIGMNPIAELVDKAGDMFIVIGVAHKIEKASK